MSSVTAEGREAAVNAAIADISHIATLPEITEKIIDLVEDPTSTAHDLHKIITNDPALCSRILKVVNSAFYGLPGQIGSINRAIVLLGLNAVKNIAIATSLAKLFRGGELCPEFSARDLWVHSTGVAAGSKLIADGLGMGLADEAFLGGLMHDIGIMVEMQTNRHKLIEVFERVKTGDSFLVAEDEIFGANHQDFGAGLCKRWKFPQSFAFVAGFHHRPLELDQSSRTLTVIVHVADKLAKAHHCGFGRDVASTEIDPAILSELNITAEKIEEIRQDLPKAIDEVQGLLT
ncbi:MAG: HDOD domain-containing protein [Phycisphaerales bacterium]